MEMEGQESSLSAALAEVERLKQENSRLETENTKLRSAEHSTLLGPLLSGQAGCSDGRADHLKRSSFQMTGDHKDRTSWVKMAQNRAHMRGAGFADADFTKPIITVAVPYSNALECNNTLLDLARRVVREIEQRGGIGFYCMCPAISDGSLQLLDPALSLSCMAGNTQGTAGMRFSLISRDWIADCIEIMHSGSSL